MATREVPGLDREPGEGDGGSEPDVITLAIPHDDRFLGVARILVGGLAARLDLPYESLDDLQLAVEALLGDPAYRVADEVTVEMEILPRQIRIAMWPLSLDRIAESLEDESEGISLRVLLSAVVDGFGVEHDGDGRRFVLRKDVQVPLT